MKKTKKNTIEHAVNYATIDRFFHSFSKKCSEIIGNPLTFFIAFVAIIIWLCSGFLFKFSDTWQLVINTITTVVTFLIVFLIQNTQNRDIEDIQIKLDELIRAKKGARNAIIDLDGLSDQELKHLEGKYKQLSVRNGQKSSQKARIRKSTVQKPSLKKKSFKRR